MATEKKQQKRRERQPLRLQRAYKTIFTESVLEFNDWLKEGKKNDARRAFKRRKGKSARGRGNSRQEPVPLEPLPPKNRRFRGEKTLRRRVAQKSKSPEPKRPRRDVPSRRPTAIRKEGQEEPNGSKMITPGSPTEKTGGWRKLLEHRRSRRDGDNVPWGFSLKGSTPGGHFQYKYCDDLSFKKKKKIILDAFSDEAMSRMSFQDGEKSSFPEIVVRRPPKNARVRLEGYKVERPMPTLSIERAKERWGRCRGQRGAAIENPTWPNERGQQKLSALPLHSYPYSRIRFDNILDDSASKSQHFRLKSIRKAVDCEPCRPATKAELERFPKSQVKKQFLKQLLKDRTIEPSEDPKGGGAIKFVPEKLTTSGRLRVCLDMVFTNAHVDETLLREWLPKFAPMEDVEKMIEKGDTMISIDFKSWYQQLPVGTSARKYTAFKTHDGKFYQFTHVAMGASYAVGVAHAITVLITEVAKGDLQIGTDCYIDNVFATGKENDVNTFKERFKKICERAHIVIGEIVQGKTISHRGIEFNSATMKKKLTEKFLAKTEGRSDYFLAKKNPSEKLMESIAGCYAYALYANDYLGFQSNPMHDWYRSRSKEGLKSAVALMKERLGHTAEIFRRWDEPEVYYAVDASSTGWGIVRRELVRDSRYSGGIYENYKQKWCRWNVRVTNGHWDDDSHINEKELLSVEKALQKEEDKRVHLVTDSMVTLFAVVGHYSRSERIHTIASRIRQIIQDQKLLLTIRYIHTKRNPADEPSRFEEINVQKLKRWRVDVGGFGWMTAGLALDQSNLTLNYPPTSCLDDESR